MCTHGADFRYDNFEETEEYVAGAAADPGRVAADPGRVAADPGRVAADPGRVAAEAGVAGESAAAHLQAEPPVDAAQPRPHAVAPREPAEASLATAWPSDAVVIEVTKRDGKLGLKITVDPTDGIVFVSLATEGSPAAEAGIRTGQQIFAVGDTKLHAGMTKKEVLGLLSVAATTIKFTLSNMTAVQIAPRADREVVILPTVGSKSGAPLDGPRRVAPKTGESNSLATPLQSAVTQGSYIEVEDARPPPPGTKADQSDAELDSRAVYLVVEHTARGGMLATPSSPRSSPDTANKRPVLFPAIWVGL